MNAPRPNWITDTKALRALAHPLRWQLLQHLDLESPMTATRGAELTGESVATCSYHLNTLTKYGFIESAAANNGRERPWRLISYDRSWRAGVEGLDDEGAVAAVALSDVVADEIASHLKEWFRRRSREDQEWVDAAGLSQGIAYLTTEQCLKPVDDLEGPYPPGDLEALKQDRRANAGRKGTTRAHRSSWFLRRRGAPPRRRGGVDR